MPLPRFRIRTLMIAVAAVGFTGGIAGLAAGLSAPKIVIGLYALDGPEPPPSFNPLIWAIQQGLMCGVALGAVGWVAICLIAQVVSWRPRMTTRRWMLAVAAVGIAFGAWLELERRERCAEYGELLRYSTEHERENREQAEALAERIPEDPEHFKYWSAYYAREAARWARERHYYEWKLARRPWLPAPPDPSPPE